MEDLRGRDARFAQRRRQARQSLARRGDLRSAADETDAPVARSRRAAATKRPPSTLSTWAALMPDPARPEPKASTTGTPAAATASAKPGSSVEEATITPST